MSVEQPSKEKRFEVVESTVAPGKLSILDNWEQRVICFVDPGKRNAAEQLAMLANKGLEAI